MFPYSPFLFAGPWLPTRLAGSPDNLSLLPQQSRSHRTRRPLQAQCSQIPSMLVGASCSNGLPPVRWATRRARAGSQSADSVLPSQAGVISGVNPIAFDSSDPLRLWVVQVGVSRRLPPLDEFTPADIWPVVIIILMTQLLSVVLTSRYIRQPRVIAEVIGGVLLGPTVSDLGLVLLPSLTNQPIFR